MPSPIECLPVEVFEIISANFDLPDYQVIRLSSQKLRLLAYRTIAKRYFANFIVSLDLQISLEIPLVSLLTSAPELQTSFTSLSMVLSCMAILSSGLVLRRFEYGLLACINVSYELFREQPVSSRRLSSVFLIA